MNNSKSHPAEETHVHGPNCEHDHDHDHDHHHHVHSTTVRYDQPKVGRNEACPCGSGKKFKHCCGSK